MAPSTFLSRFTSIKGSSNADSNSRHARMASASSIGGASTNGSNAGSPTFTPAKDAPPVPPMPRLVLTTENLDRSSVHAPATPVSKKSSKGPPSILDGVDVTMSPEQARSSEEDQKRMTGGRKRAASSAMGPIPDIIPPPPLLPAAELNTPTPKSTQRSFTDVPAAPEQPKAPNGTLNSRKPGDMALASTTSGAGSSATNVGSPAAKSLSSKNSNIDLKRAIEGTLNAFSPPSRAGTDVSEGGGTRSRSNTQFLSVAPTSDDGASDTASIISASGKKRKKLWKKASTSSFRGDKKGGGSALGAALAASGMSLAHATAAPTTTQAVLVSPERLRQDTQKVKEPTRSFTALSSNFKPRRGSGDTDMDSEGAYDSDSQSGLSFNDRDIPITGFAVASSKRNADFHDLFPDVPDGDYLIEDYGCALQKEFLVQGRLYISENHMCFHANIFDWVTNVTVPFANVTSLEKRMTAFVIPNAIQVNTIDQRYLFASFLSRDTTFDVVQNIWRLAHPDGPPASDAASGNIKFEGATTVLVNSTNSSVVQSPTQENGPQGRKSPSAAANGLPAHKPTQCECGKNGTHYPETVWEAVLPGIPEKIYNLIFASGFIKDFLAKDQKLISLQMSDWYPESERSQLLARTMSYIKPLNGSIGPKQTKCELKDETVHVDFDSYVSIVTTTRAPDVPSGGVFVCKTRTCIMWAGPESTKIIVTTEVEWSGRSFIKSIIERSAFDGQRTYYSDLDRAMRKYISDPPTGLIPEGAPLDTDASGFIAYADVDALITWISPTPFKINGGFGDVFAGTHLRAGKVALKRPRIGPTGYNEDLMRRFQREAATWEKLQHPHILKYLGTFQRDGHLYFVSPFIENGTLVEYIVLHPNVNRIKLVCETADAISYLHAQGVVHGDIKASNLLVGDEGQVLLCDFGLTKTTDLSTTTAMKGVGSLRWQSPELWDGVSKSFKSDVYAFGMTIAEVLTGDVPFPDLQTEGAVIRAVLIQDRRPAKIPAVSSTGLSYKRVWEVAEACWSTIPEERISMNEALRLVQDDLQLAMVQEIDGLAI